MFLSVCFFGITKIVSSCLPIILLFCFICMCLSDLMLNDDQLKAYTLVEIEMLLKSYGKNLSKYPPMPTTDRSLVPDVQNKLI